MTTETASPAVLLREAASRMRELAQAAISLGDGDWYESLGDILAEEYPHLRAESWKDDAAHIAAWHPAVALAVADLLEHIADDMSDEQAVEVTRPRVDGGTYSVVCDAHFDRWDWTAALYLARVFLGTDR